MGEKWRLGSDDRELTAMGSYRINKSGPWRDSQINPICGAQFTVVESPTCLFALSLSFLWLLGIHIGE